MFSCFRSSGFIRCILEKSSCDDDHPQVLGVLPRCDEGCHGRSVPSTGGTQNPRMKIVLVPPQDVVAQACPRE